MEAKIFISHRSRDVEYAKAFVDFLEDLGVPSEVIVCTSVQDHLIPNGERIYEWLREQFVKYELHILFLLSDNYYESPDCLNEMGAAWVTKADSDVILLPGFSPEDMRGCIGKDMMGIYCDGDCEILKDRISQLRDKICKEFGLKSPTERRWEKIRAALLNTLHHEKAKTKEKAVTNQHPVFDIRICDTNKKVPGTIESIENNFPPKHKNVMYAVQMKNSTSITDLKVFGRNIDTVVQRDHPYYISICYMESPDSQWKPYVYVLSRDNYPAGSDGVPKVVSIEYTMDEIKYRQDYILAGNNEYRAGTLKKVDTLDPETVVRMKNRMREVFLRTPEETRKYYSAIEISRDPTTKLKERDAIIMSQECRDPKWNTDDGFARYEVYDFCDEGILFRDPMQSTVEVEFYLRNYLVKTKAKRLLCLKFEDITAIDPEGNHGYNIPVIFTKYMLGETPFVFYYLSDERYGMISNSAITSVKEQG